MNSHRKNVGILIEAPTKDTVASARSVIMDILNCEKSGDPVKLQALITLDLLCSVRSTSISGCTIDMGAK